MSLRRCAQSIKFPWQRLRIACLGTAYGPEALDSAGRRVTALCTNREPAICK